MLFSHNAQRYGHTVRRTGTQKNRWQYHAL